MDISGTPIRVVRAALFTALVVMLSAASHILLSRAPLPLTTCLAVTAGVYVIAYALAGRERGFGRIAALLIPLELAADTVFTSGQHVCYGQSGGPVTGPLRSFGVDVLCGGTSVGTPLARMAGGESHGAASLLADGGPATAWLLLGAHVGVGLLAAAWLGRMERAVAGLFRAAAAATFRPLLLAVAAVARRAGPARRLPRPVRRTPLVRTRLLVHCVGRRGPPCSALFA
ncbi:hypothetical protein [Streptomyces flavofungini]|uniref:hypothetical protein n=1 Tax=Streptomyces flavofungini TaxID=68200 RepID=UPI0025B0C49E|nr:hypothetical protein [Streptomyces flavofungini]WJV49341.1 hypothetical protein QUY26_29815 [Streptomyces flavofungini]